jgi:hypothetical protein
MRNNIHATAEKLQQFNNRIQARKRDFAEKDQSSKTFSLTLFLFLSAFFSPFAGIAQNTLDNIGLTAGAPSAAAFSLRKLTSTYSGSAIRVRRSSDNNQQDIAFNGLGRLDTTALKTFVGSSSGYITIWYDQSGFGKHASQATNAKQPRIVNAGTVDLQNGKPAIIFSGAQNLQTSLTGVQASTGGNITTANIVFKNNTANTGILSNGDGGTNRYTILAPWGDGNTYFDLGNAGSGGRLTGALTWTNMSVGTFQRNNTQANIWKNGLSILSSSTLSTTVTSTNSMFIGSYDATNYYINGAMAELIVFPSALSTADRQTLECNQSTYYAITESAPPVIVCPATQYLNLSSTCSATLPSYTSLATVSDNCTPSGSIVVTQSPAAGSVVTGAGIQAITLTATDAAGNSSSCSFNIYKQDVTAPVISCPSNITTTVDAGTCGAVVNYTITATDDCSGTNCAPASISGYTLIGTYNGHVYFRSATTALWPTAKANAQALGAHLVTIASAGEKTFLGGLGAHWGGMTDEVTEGTWLWVTGEPVVYTSWSAGEPNNSGGNQDYLVLNYSGTNWDDQGTTTTTLLPYIIEFDCLSTNLVAGLASGSVFPIGTTTVTYNASDNAGNVSTNCSFTVTVNETTPPSISCPATQTLNLGASCSAALPNYTTLATKSDNCTPTASIAVTQSPAAGTIVSNTGTEVITLTATDAAGNSSTCTFNVSKVDVTAPVVTCPAAQTLDLNASCSASLPDYTSLATATDNCTSGLTIVQSPAPGTVVNSTGTIRVTLAATDAAGNTGNCTFNVTKRDVTPPVMICPADITTTVAPGMCGAIVNYTIGATDNCSASACAPSSITGYTALGTLNGHTYFRSNASTTWATAYSNSIALGAHLVTISSAAENAFFAGLGSHWTGFTDQAVEGTWAWVTGEPVVYTSWAGGEPNDYGGNEDYMQLNWSGTTWNDNNGAAAFPYIIEYDCMPVTMIAGYTSGSLFPVGTTTVTYNATDAAGNTSADCSFTVTVTDNVAPTIACPANISVTAAAGACTAIVNYTTPIATDNCGSCSSAPPVAGYAVLGLYNGNAYYISTATANATTAFAAAASMGGAVASVASASENTFIRNAANAAGYTGNYYIGFNDATTEGTFVWPSGEPILYTNWNAGEPNNAGNEDYTVVYNSGVWNDVNVSTLNNYVVKVPCINPVKTSGLASGSTFPVGVSTISYSATDASGNTANCSFTVTVSLNASSINKTVTATAPTVCTSGSTNITVALSDAGVNYQLRDNATNTNIGTAVAGTGGTISLPTGTLSATTTFNILATNTSAGCSYQLTNMATVTVVTPPADRTVAAAASAVCSGSATNITVALSQSGINYQLRNNATNAAIGAAVAGTGGTINLPTGAIAANTTYNVLASNAGCSVQMSNTPTVTVNALPATPAGGNNSRCGTGTVTITATPGAGETIDWYSAASGGTLLLTGNTSYTTPSISATTIYYAQARNTTTGCLAAARRAVTATVNPLPASPTAGNNSRCSTGTVTITATPGSGETIDWYSAAAGGTLLLTGNTSYTTASISASATYYAQARNTTTGCLAAARTAVTATVNPLPASAAAGNSSRCGTGTVTITATPGGGETIDWYSAASGGTLLLTGNTSYTTASISATTIYYAQARNSTTGCLAAARTAVTATVNALPTDKTPVAVTATLCSGNSTIIQIATSQSGVSYQLRNNTGNIAIGSQVAGTGATIDLPTGTLTATTTFNVLATTTTTSCNVQMTNTVTVTVNASGQWIGASTGDWNNAANWCGGIPSASTNVNIPAGTTVNIQTANATANNVTIASTASLVMTGTYNLNITAGGTFTNNGTFTATGSTGTVAFLGNGSISGTTTFKNIDTYGALDFGTASTVSGTFSLQTGGSVTGHSPTYTCPSSILLYKPGTIFNRGLEWTTASSGAGYPANVVVQNNTTINFPAVGNGYVCYDVQIDAGSSLKQNYSGGSASLSVGRNITINGTLELGAASGGDISLGGSWTRNTGGVFNANDRTVIFDGPSNFSGNGTAMSTITAPASAAKDNEGGFGGENFAHLWINKASASDSVVLLSNITVTRELGFTQGTFSLRNSDVTLVSNSTRTADIAPVTTPANINVRYAGTGKFVIQRFIQNPTATRSWRLLTAPLQNTTAPSINTAYMEGVVNPDRLSPNGSGGIYNPWPGYGTHITGPGGIYSASNGFDQGTNSSSILYANAGVTSWLTPTSTIATKVTDQQGWMLFVRGSRGFAIGDQYTPSQNTTLEPKGRINIGNVVIPVAAGRQVIGNPYPSAISLLDVDVAGTLGRSGSYHMWDPKMFTSYTQPGKWVSFTGIGSSFVQTTSASAYPSNGTIESGQAFLMDVATAGNITFHETDKLALTSSLVGIANATGARPVANPVFPMIRSDIYAKSDSTYRLTDGVLNIFNADFNNAANEDDAKKIISFNTKENLSILRDSSKIAIEKRSDLQQTDTIFFAMSKFNELPYRFRFEASDFAPGYQAFLEDKFTGSRTSLNINGVSEVDFNITANPLSKAEDRFRIVFRSSYIVLPVTFTSVKAWQQNSNITVQWNVANETNIKAFDVEKSTDGSHFSKVNTTLSLGNFAGNRSYNWLDEHAITGYNYYRIVSKGTDAGSQYSQVVKVNMAGSKGSISLFANPVTDGNIRLNFKEMEQGSYTARLLNEAGQLIFGSTVNHAGGSSINSLPYHQKITPGIYNLEITTAGLKKTVLKLIIQ